MMKLSVLDQSVVSQGRSHGDAIRDTLALAQHCEALGYHRFWVSEHHNHDTIVGSAPEILMAAIAAATKRIRIGSAGVMLPHYSTYKVAEQFRVLEAIAPGRIDLGVGRAPGSDGLTARAVNPHGDGQAEQFPYQVRDLDAWIHGEPLPPNHPFGEIRAFPAGDSAPDLWMLGSSDYGAQLAAHYGLPYAFAHFITDGRGAERALSLYRRLFTPHPRTPQPRATLCVWALAAETEEEADYHFAPRAWWKLVRNRGILQPLPTPEQALAFPMSSADRSFVTQLRQESLVGSAPNVAAKLRALAESLALDELVILTWAHDPAARQTSYRLLAQEFSLTQ